MVDDPSAAAAAHAAHRTVDDFVAAGRSLASDEATVELLIEATSEPSLTAFVEILELPAVKSLEASPREESRRMHRLLMLYAYGTWAGYKQDRAALPALSQEQELKLKQLSVITLAEQSKVLSYELLMSELDISSVRELEDLLINHCIYTETVIGKMDQKAGYFEVENAVGRDLRPGQLDEMISTLTEWLAVSDGLLRDIEERVEQAEESSLANQNHKKRVNKRVEDAKTTMRAEVELRGHDSMVTEGVEMMEEDRLTGRPKRRR